MWKMSLSPLLYRQLCILFNSAIIKYFGLKPIIVGPGIRTGIRIATTNPKETGQIELWML